MNTIKSKSKLLIIAGNVMLVIFCIFQIIIDLNNTIFAILVGISVFIELIGIALEKDE